MSPLRAQRIQRVVGILGVPRSGTTMFAAVLDAHSDVFSIYEPWNANKDKLGDGGMKITVRTLVAEAEQKGTTATTLVVKETGTRLAYFKYLAAALDEFGEPQNTYLVILLRNPLHCFLSEFDGRRKWWGEPSLEMSADIFSVWAERTRHALQELVRLGRIYNSAFVFYEACVSNPVSTFRDVMRSVGLTFEKSQLEITKNSDLTKVRGDLSLVEKARDVENSSLAKREQDLAERVGVISASPWYPTIVAIANFFESYRERGVISAQHSDRELFIEGLWALVR